MRLVVRANELNCRNGWNADLWVPADADGSKQPETPLAGIRGRAAAEVKPGQQNDLITSIVAAKTENLSLPENHPSLPDASGKPAIEEDIIVEQAPSLSWKSPSNGPISTQPATELVQNPKAAILRARDQFRERRKSEGRLADQQLVDPSPTFLASSREARLVHDNDLTPPEPDPDSVDPRFENRQLLRPFAPQSHDGNRPVSPVTPQEIDRPFPSLTEFPEDRARFESVPYVEPGRVDAETFENEILDVAQHDTWIETRQVDTVLPEPYVVDDFFEEDELAAEAGPVLFEDEELSVHHRESILNRFLRQRRERRQQIDYVDEVYEDEPVRPPIAARSAAPEPATGWDEAEWLPEPPTAMARPIEAEPTEVQEQPAPFERTRELEHLTESSLEADAHVPEPRPERQIPVQQHADEVDDFVLPPPLPEIQPSEHQTTQAYAARRRPQIEPEREVQRSSVALPEPRVADEFGDQPLFAAQPIPLAEDIEIDAHYVRSEPLAQASHRMERICQTCRDFRPSENGERGWCNNKWAFNHRRMVDADDLACRNSLGSWWTPKDETWRRDGDISRNAQQTPRVDQWLLGTRENDSERRRSGS